MLNPNTVETQPLIEILTKFVYLQSTKFVSHDLNNDEPSSLLINCRASIDYKNIKKRKKGGRKTFAAAVKRKQTLRDEDKRYRFVFATSTSNAGVIRASKASSEVQYVYLDPLLFCVSLLEFTFISRSCSFAKIYEKAEIIIVTCDYEKTLNKQAVRNCHSNKQKNLNCDVNFYFMIFFSLYS